jgi:molybdopterin synthase catalytic subunit
MDAARQQIRVTVGSDPIDVAPLVREVARPDSGASVVFLGTVRDHSAAHDSVTHLEYEVHPELVEPKIKEIVDEAARFIIDELKTRAPIWKKEHWPGGSEWSPGS